MKKLILFVTLFNTFLFATHKEVVIDLSEQMGYAYEDGYVVFEGRISSGKKGRETPTGDFYILQKKRYHRSNLWPKPNGGAKMNYMMRLTNGGIAMHLGYVPNKPASHGCVRLKNGFAQELFKWTRVGTHVYVEGDIRDFFFYKRHHNDYYRDRYYDDENYYGVITSYYD